MDGCFARPWSPWPRRLTQAPTRSVASKDYYAVLGVPRHADDAALKKAYRTLARQHHPDKNPGDGRAEERFKEISEAYAVLADPDKRAQYDRFGTVSGPGGPGDAGFGTIFEDLFEGFFGGGGSVNRYPCSACRGEGRVARERMLTVTIPAGIADGNQLRLTGEGEGGLHGAPPGDLYVLVQIRPHEIFERHGADLVCALPLTYPQVCLGDEVDVPVLDGKARLTVPAGTQPGQRLVLKGRGIPHLRGRGHGNAVHEVILEVPKKLSPRERELLGELHEVSKESSGPLLSSF